MNEAHDQSQTMNLPSTQPEQGGVHYEKPVAGLTPEKAETLHDGGPSQGPPPAHAPILPAGMPTSPPSAPPVATAVPATAPAIADDVDLIEREWVQRAKAIVEQTRNDPHLQSREINKFKAEYIRKRYNKELKLSED